MEEQAVISYVHEVLVVLSFTLSFNLEHVDLVSFQVDIRVCVLDVSLNSFMLSRIGVQVIDINVESVMEIINRVNFILSVQSAQQYFGGLLNID